MQDLLKRAWDVLAASTWGRFPDVYGEAKCRLSAAVKSLESVRMKA